MTKPPIFMGPLTDVEKKDTESPGQVVQFQSEKQLALELKTGIQGKLEELAHEMDKAAQAGFAVSFQVTMSPHGRYVVMGLSLAKHY